MFKIHNSKTEEKKNPFPWIKEGHEFIIDSILSPKVSHKLCPYMELSFGWFPNYIYRTEVFDSDGNQIQRTEPSKENIVTVNSINKQLLKMLNIDHQKVMSANIHLKPDDIPVVTLRFVYKDGYKYSIFMKKTEG